MINFVRTCLYMCLLSACLFACRKTDALPDQPAKRILEYKVVNIPEGNIAGVIDETDQTITVYLPFYYNLLVIEPEIVLATGYSIKEEILPVKISDKPFVYTVTGKDNSSTRYTLHVKIQQPKFKLAELSAPSGYFKANVRNTITIKGGFNTTDLSVINPFLVSDKTGKEIAVSTEGARIFSQPDNTGGIIYLLSNVRLPADIDTGLYRIKVKIYNESAMTELPIRIGYPQPSFIMPYGKTFRQGEVFKMLAAGTSVIRGFKSFTVNVNGNYLPLQVQSFTLFEATVKVPDDFPPGVYAEVKLGFDGYPELNNYAYFTIENK